MITLAKMFIIFSTVQDNHIGIDEMYENMKEK